MYQQLRKGVCMKNIPFSREELKVVSEEPSFFGGVKQVYNFPITPREECMRTYMDKNPDWLMSDVETVMFMPSVIPDNIARGSCFEAGDPLPREQFGGKDMFGVKWVFVDIAGGSMEDPNEPRLLTDANEWPEKVVWPDIDSWDWEGSAERNRDLLANGKSFELVFLNGPWFERLLSFMGFETAAMALLDDEQEDALKALLHKTTDLYIRLVDKALEYYDIDGFMVHDDWGSQKAPFFSEAVAREFFLPEMKRYNDHIHSKGKYSELHSCGHIEDRCNIFAEAGFDIWAPMPMNNTIDLYQKYGDKISIGLVYDRPFDPATASEEEQRAAARDLVDRLLEPGKNCFYSFAYNAKGMMTPAFRQELYIASREKFSKQ